MFLRGEKFFRTNSHLKHNISLKIQFDKFSYYFLGTLPDHVHLLTLRSRDAFSDEVIVRFMHLYESDSPIKSYTETTPVSISQLFSAFELNNIRAVSISLNRGKNKFSIQNTYFQNLILLNQSILSM